MTEENSPARIALLSSVFVLGCLALVVAFAGDTLFPPDIDELSAEDSKLAGEFIEGENPVSDASSGDDESSAAVDFAPDKESDSVDEVVEDAEPIPAVAQIEEAGGPLKKSGWTYAWAGIDRDKPQDSFVLLRRERKDDRGNPVRDEVSFYIGDTRIRDAQLGLDFVAVSADAKRFAYFLPDRPDILYSLQRESSKFFKTR